LAPNLPLPYAQDWDLNVQRSFGNDFLVEVGYVGTKGTKLPRFVEANPAVFVPGESSSRNVEQRRLHSGCGIGDPERACIYSSTNGPCPSGKSRRTGISPLWLIGRSTESSRRCRGRLSQCLTPMIIRCRVERPKSQASTRIAQT